MGFGKGNRDFSAAGLSGFDQLCWATFGAFASDYFPGELGSLQGAFQSSAGYIIVQLCKKLLTCQ